MIVYYTEYIAYQIYSNRNYARCGTFRLESSFPAKAKSRLVFPDPGGPSNNDILKNKNPRCKQKLQSAEKKTGLSSFLISYLPGFMIPLTL
jgi:hypothetical protein